MSADAVFPVDRRPARVAALRDALARADLDALLVTALPNIRYLTGFAGSSALLLVTPLECMIFTDFRYAAQVEEEVGGFASCLLYTSDAADE
mgnify:CR=1 FL=1